MNNDKDVPSVLEIPSPNAIIVPAPASQVREVIEKFLNAKEYVEPERVKNLWYLTGTLMNWDTKVAGKAHAIGIGTVGKNTFVYDGRFFLPSNVDFIRELSEQVHGKVCAGIWEKHSGSYGLIVFDNGKMLRHFSDECGKISANSGRLPGEDPKLEQDAWDGVINAWRKLVPADEVKDLEVHVYSKGPLTAELERLESNSRNLQLLIKKGDESAKAHDYENAMSSYRDAFIAAKNKMFTEPGDRRNFEILQELANKMDKCQTKLPLPQGRIVVPKVRALSVTETVGVMTKSGDDSVKKRKYKEALHSYESALMLAKGMQERHANSPDWPTAVKELKQKIKECKAKISK